MGRWWNRMPHNDGLFDYQNTIRPAYFAFKLLSRRTGETVLVSNDPTRRFTASLRTIPST